MLFNSTLISSDLFVSKWVVNSSAISLYLPHNHRCSGNVSCWWSQYFQEIIWPYTDDGIQVSFSEQLKRFGDLQRKHMRMILQWITEKTLKANLRVILWVYFPWWESLDTAMSQVSIEYILSGTLPHAVFFYAVFHYLMPYSKILFSHMRQLTLTEIKLFVYDHSSRKK